MYVYGFCSLFVALLFIYVSGSQNQKLVHSVGSESESLNKVETWDEG